MSRSLQELLKAYEPILPEEQDVKLRMLAFIQQYPLCFDRTLQVGHITSSIWLLNHDKSKALLMHHAKLDKWLQLGGHCDGNPDVLAVAIKEAQEESGIQAIVPVSEHIFDLAIHVFPAMGTNPEHVHYDVRFLLQVISQDAIVRNQESKELRWITKDRSQLPTDEPSVVRMFDKWVRS